MRATSLQDSVSRSTRNGRRLTVFVVMALGTSAVAMPVVAFDGLSLIPQTGQLLLGQQNKKQAKKTTPKAKEAAQIDPALKRDPVALPPDYKVPPVPLPDLEIIKELPVLKPVTSSKEDGYKEWREHGTKMREYKTLLRQGTFKDKNSQKEVLRYGLKYKLAELTQRKILFPSDEDREKIAKLAKDPDKKITSRDAPPTIAFLRDEILADLHDTSGAVNGAFEVRDTFIDLICEECPKLFDNNFYVRYNMAEILSVINDRDQDNLKNQAEEPCFRATKPLLDLVNDPKQNSMYKLHPVLALAKICRHKKCKPEDRFAIIDCLTSQMIAAKQLPDWYAMRVAESLCQLGEPNDRTRTPVVVVALVNVLKDKGYTFRVRSQAAHSLGRIPLEGYRKSDDIAVEILRLAEQMAVEYEKTKANPIWKHYFAEVYFAFQPEDAAERNENKSLLLQVNSKPALAGTKTVVTEVYQLYIPLAQNVLGGKATASVPDQLRKIKTWLDARAKPGDGNVAAGTAAGGANAERATTSPTP